MKETHNRSRDSVETFVMEYPEASLLGQVKTKLHSHEEYIVLTDVAKDLVSSHIATQFRNPGFHNYRSDVDSFKNIIILCNVHI